MRMIRLAEPPVLPALICAALLTLAGPARALDLTLPFSSQITTQVITAPDSHALATGPFVDGALPLQVLEGRVERQVYRMPGQSLTTLQLLAPLRDQLAAEGYEMLFECHAAACGGFDFRFGIEVLPAPDMYVDLTDFRYLAARNGAQDHLGLLISASSNAGFIQVIRVASDPEALPLRINAPDDTADATGSGTLAPAISPEAAIEAPPPRLEPVTLADSLNQRGHVILSDLTFDTGSAQLATGRFATLEKLADFLLADPSLRIALVGHTDAVGALPGNINLSRQRARSVLDRLVADYGVPASQLEAEGMGYLSPIAPNTNSAGREVNRRVEAVLLNTE